MILTEGCQLALGPGIVFGVQAGVPAAAWPMPPQPAAVGAAAAGSGLTWGILGAVAVLALLVLAGALIGAYFLVLKPSGGLPVAQPPQLGQPAQGPQVAFQEPAPGTRIGLGAPVLIFANARDEQKVTRLDLWIDDVLVAQQSSPAPEGVTPLSLVYRWTAPTPGDHYFLVRAYDGGGAPGESPLLYVAVSDDPPPPQDVQYLTQPGDTLESLAHKHGVSVQEIRDANPAVGDEVVPGQVIVIPVPQRPPAAPPAPAGPTPPQSPMPGVSPPAPSQSPPAAQVATPTTPPAQPATPATPGQPPAPAQPATPAQPPAPAQPATPATPAQPPAPAQPATLATPATPPAPPPPAPNITLMPPTLVGASVADCKVTLTWQDNAETEDGFGVMRVAIGQPAFQLLKPFVGKAPGKGKSLQFIDRVPGPNTYIYYVAAGTLAGARAGSNLKTVTVQPTAACAEPPGYKQVVFQPLQIKAGQDEGLALYFDVGNRIYRRIPLNGRLVSGDWSAYRQAVPAPTYLKPGDSLVLSIVGEARARRASHGLGSIVRSHALSELTPNKQWQGNVAKTGLDVTYRLWLENVKWGEAANNQIPAPARPRLAGDARELDMLAGCAPGKCDPKVLRALVWDWKGDPRIIEGYLLLRTYRCSGKETHYTDVIVGADQKGRIVPPGSEPAGCTARYQVSAFGPAGVSPPSEALEVPPPKLQGAKVVVRFKQVKVLPQMPASQVGQVDLQANEQMVRSQPLMLESVAIAPLSPVLDLSRQYLDGMQPNNEFVLFLGASDSLQLGFNVRVADDTCIAQQFVSPPAGQTWAELPDQQLTLQSADGKCEAEVRVGQSSSALSAEEPPRPKADIWTRDIFYQGRDVYMTLYNLGPDKLPDNLINVHAAWVRHAETGHGEPLESFSGFVKWPPNEDRFALKVGSRDDVDRTWGAAATARFSVDVKPFDFDGSWHQHLSSVAIYGTVALDKAPNGFGCRRNEDCDSGYCADSKFCAPAKGTGKGGGSTVITTTSVRPTCASARTVGRATVASAKAGKSSPRSDPPVTAARPSPTASRARPMRTACLGTAPTASAPPRTARALQVRTATTTTNVGAACATARART